MSTAAGGAGEVSQLRGPSPPAPSPAKPPGDPASQSAQPDLLMPLMPPPTWFSKTLGTNKDIKKVKDSIKHGNKKNGKASITIAGWCWDKGGGVGVRA